MMETTEKEAKGGCPCMDAAPCKENCTSPNKKVSHPALCQLCEGEYHIQEDGPDAGEAFACGIMIENMECRDMWFSCPYFKVKTFHQVGVLDADECNRAIKLVRILKQRKSPVIVAEEVVHEPSPHEFLDHAAARYNTIVKTCDKCPVCDICTISKELTAPDRCGILRRAL